jgi:hypothetical protein
MVLSTPSVPSKLDSSIMHCGKRILLGFVYRSLKNGLCLLNSAPKAFLECRRLVIEDVLDVTELAKLDTSSFITAGYKILWFDVQDGILTLMFQLEIKGKSSILHTMEGNKSHSHSIVKMVLGIMPLLADLEHNIQVIPYHHKGTGVGNLPRLLQVFTSKFLELGNSLGV